MNAIIKNVARTLVIENVSRRGFLHGAAATGGLVIAAQLLPTQGAGLSPPAPTTMPHGVVTDPHVFVSIAPNGTVTIVATRAEMGTGAARTIVADDVADELDADWSRVKVVQSPGNEEKYGNQDTDGSRSTRHFIQPMRQIGASVRHMLEAAAAKRWGVAVAEVEAQNHEVVHKRLRAQARLWRAGRRGHGNADAAGRSRSSSRIPAPSATSARARSPIVDQLDITTGRAHYGIDAKLPGMKYAVIARPPVIGGKLVSFDDNAAMKVPGVEKVVTIDGTPAPAKFQPLGGVAVIASNTWAAIKGRDALKIRPGTTGRTAPTIPWPTRRR